MLHEASFVSKPISQKNNTNLPPTRTTNPNADIGLFLPTSTRTAGERPSATAEEILAVQTASSKQAVDPITRTRISNNAILPSGLRKHENNATITLESRSDSFAPFENNSAEDENKSQLHSIYGTSQTSQIFQDKQPTI